MYARKFSAYRIILTTNSKVFIMYSFHLITFSINFYALSILFESAFNSIWMPFQFYLKGLSIPFLRAQKIFPHVLSRCEIEVNLFLFALCQREYAIILFANALKLWANSLTLCANSRKNGKNVRCSMFNVQ